MPSIDTNTISIGTMLKRTEPLSVPKFQRDFSWETDQIEQFWDDINRAIEERADSYVRRQVF